MEEGFFHHGFASGVIKKLFVSERAKRDLLADQFPFFGKKQGRGFDAWPDFKVFFQWEKKLGEARGWGGFLDHVEAAHRPSFYRVVIDRGTFFVVALPFARF